MPKELPRGVEDFERGPKKRVTNKGFRSAKQMNEADRAKNGDIESKIPDTVLAAIKQIDSSFDSASLLEAIIRHFGGIEAVAFALKEEFDALPAGSQGRQKILELINRLTVNVTRDKPETVNWDDLDDDELIIAAGHVIGAISKKRVGVKNGLQ